MFQILFHYAGIFVEFAIVCLSAFTHYLFPSCFLHCKADDGLAQLERKIWVLEQEKVLETTEGTLTSFPKIVGLTQ